MTLGAVEIKKVRRYFKNFDVGKVTSLNRAGTPLSGKTLAHRLKGLLTTKEANQLDRHINESCEQVDD